MPRREIGRYLKKTAIILSCSLAAFIIVTKSQSFYDCTHQITQDQSAYEAFSKIASIEDFFSLGQFYVGCGASVIDTHNGIVSAIATLVIAWLTISLVIVTTRQAELTKASVEIAERALTEIERAFVYIDGFNTELTVLTDQKEPDLSVLELTINKDPSLHITRLAVQPRWKNSGNTPTKNMVFRINWAGPAETIPPDNRFVGDAVGFFIGPNAIENSDFIRILGGETMIAHAIHCIDPEPLVCIWGRADYEDIFGKAHFHEWCYRVRLERHKGPDERMRATLIQYGDFNRSD